MCYVVQKQDLHAMLLWPHCKMLISDGKLLVLLVWFNWSLSDPTHVERPHMLSRVQLYVINRVSFSLPQTETLEEEERDKPQKMTERDILWLCMLQQCFSNHKHNFPFYAFSTNCYSSNIYQLILAIFRPSIIIKSKNTQ